MLAGLQEPILDQLRPKLDFMRAHRPEVHLALDSVKPMHIGQFAAGAQMQEIKFESPARGRYFCIESRSAHDGRPYAAIAAVAGHPVTYEPVEPDVFEARLLASGMPKWRAFDLAHIASAYGTAENAIDGQVANFWHTQWGSASPNHPHRLVLDLGETRSLSGFRYVPRQGTGTVGGRIKDYSIYVSDRIVEK